MWSTEHEETTSADPAAVWALWEDPDRWPEWNERMEWARMDAPLAAGAEAEVKFRRSRPIRFVVTQLDPGRSFTDEGRLPGVRLGHEHEVRPEGAGARIRHRLYFEGPLAGLYGALMGRQMRASVRDFAARERTLAEGTA